MDSTVRIIRKRTRCGLRRATGRPTEVTVSDLVTRARTEGLHLRSRAARRRDDSVTALLAEVDGLLAGAARPVVTA